MSALIKPGGDPITNKSQLVEDMETGSKPPDDWRIGTEHEKFAYALDTLKRLPYEGVPGIGALLDGMRRFDWEPVVEGGNTIALKRPDGCSVTLEPGGQFELSGAPLRTIHETCAEVHEHLDQVKEVCGEIGAGVVGLGFDPKSRREDVGWMPKGRYKIMRDYMPTRGTLGLDMMLRTCTVQVNLDFQSEADMVKKMRVAVALQPIATALFAASPFTEGKPNGFLSYRSHVWTDTDPDRCGMLPFVFEDGFGFERWVDYILDVPMYFIYRSGVYQNVAGRSFRDYMDGRLEGHIGELPTMDDWTDHMTTAFPEVRLKHFIEMRGADGGPWRGLCALPALWVGLLYDSTALDAAWDLCKDWTDAERTALRDDAPRLGLKTPFRSETIRDIALRVLEVSRAGLANRRKLDKSGKDEAMFLDVLDDIATSGVTAADAMLEAYQDRWNGDIDKLYGEYSY
ncbi:MAG: glutamate--cysteine ligase [Rhodospirillaceae bacterium]|jgi:glutamate--cysteine ligase|nr:glutamate--cysteine ligase [Rhodospirillaceae bacterium]MBT5810841.1 glutamate--cysteine ligase [Rhodospirillaceae bacterium]